MENSKVEKRMFNLSDVCAYCNLGLNKAREFMDEIGATVKVGRRVLFDKKVIDRYLDNPSNFKK